METLIDLGIVAFIPIMIYRGYKRGIIMGICGFLSIYVSFMGASFLSNNFYEPVGRLVQPVVKEIIVDVLEEQLQFENILVEAPVEALGSGLVPGEYMETEGVQEYLGLNRALSLLGSSEKLKKYHGFISIAEDILTTQSSHYVGSVTDVISTVIGREIAKLMVFSVCFVLALTLWLLFSRVLVLVFQLPVLAEINGYLGAALGLFLALFVIYVFAWVTGGTLISWAGVERTVLYEFFVKTSPMDALAIATDVSLDL